MEDSKSLQSVDAFKGLGVEQIAKEIYGAV